MICNRRNFAILRPAKIFRLIGVFICVFILYFVWVSYQKQNVNPKEETKAKQKVLKLPSKNSICIVLTAEQSITTRGVGVWDTWGPDCDTTIFACNCQNIKKYNELIAKKETIPNDLQQFSKVAHLPILYLNIEENYNKMIKFLCIVHSLILYSYV